MCDVPPAIVKVTSDWLCDRPLEHSSAFLLLLVRSAVEEEAVQTSRGGAGGGKSMPTPAKAKVRASHPEAQDVTMAGGKEGGRSK